MDVATVTEFISTLGFPIAVCLICFWYIHDISTKHKEETDKFVEALNSNTLVLQKLCDKLDLEGK